jgi:hypothetical protein
LFNYYYGRSPYSFFVQGHDVCKLLLFNYYYGRSPYQEFGYPSPLAGLVSGADYTRELYKFETVPE